MRYDKFYLGLGNLALVWLLVGVEELKDDLELTGHEGVLLLDSLKIDSGKTQLLLPENEGDSCFSKKSQQTTYKKIQEHFKSYKKLQKNYLSSRKL